jgi:hypothetical protein
VVIGAGIVFAEPGVNKGVVRRLVVDPQEEELSGLEVGLELEGGDSERYGVRQEGLQLDCDCSGKRAHLALTIPCRVFIEERCCCWYCFIKSGAWIWAMGSHILSLLGYPNHLTKY